MRHYDCGVSRRSAQAGPVRQFESSVPSSLAISIPSPILAYRVWSLNSTHTVHPIRTRPNSNLCLILPKSQILLNTWYIYNYGNFIHSILFQTQSLCGLPSFPACVNVITPVIHLDRLRGSTLTCSGSVRTPGSQFRQMAFSAWDYQKSDFTVLDCYWKYLFMLLWLSIEIMHCEKPTVGMLDGALSPLSAHWD